MTNPFEAIGKELSDIKGILLDLKNSEKNAQSPPPPLNFKYIPIQNIFKKKICSKPTFYEHLRAGEFTLYKFGNKSFVDLIEFEKAFHAVRFNNKK